jgi:hypothetical protein
VIKELNCNFGLDKPPFKGFTGQYFSALFTGVLIPPKPENMNFILPEMTVLQCGWIVN